MSASCSSNGAGAACTSTACATGAVTVAKARQSAVATTTEVRTRCSPSSASVFTPDRSRLSAVGMAVQGAMSLQRHEGVLEGENRLDLSQGTRDTCRQTDLIAFGLKGPR